MKRKCDSSPSPPKSTSSPIKEGEAVCSLRTNVFYNKVQAINRDLSVIFLRSVLPSDDSTRILEAFSGSGIRAVRYALELKKSPADLEVVANDLEFKACQLAEETAKLNGVESMVKPKCNDAEREIVMGGPYDVIDIDPYGTPSPCMDSAVRFVKVTRRRPGIVLVTATDAIVLCGHDVGACFSKYGATNTSGISSCHEVALRILLYSLQMSAARAGRYIKPLLSLHIDFYFRLFIQVRKGSLAGREIARSKIGNLLYCSDCQWFASSPILLPFAKESDSKLKAARVPAHSRCPVCSNEAIRMIGPIWTGELHDKQTIDKMNAEIGEMNVFGSSRDRIQGGLNLAQQEIGGGLLFFNPSHLCKIIGCQAIGMKKLKSALINAGYTASYSHCDLNCVKTTADMETIWKIIRMWAKEQPIGGKASTPIAKRLREIPLEESFDFKCNGDAEELGKIEYASVFLTNPEPKWGPKSRARGE